MTHNRIHTIADLLVLGIASVAALTGYTDLAILGIIIYLAGQSLTRKEIK